VSPISSAEPGCGRAPWIEDLDDDLAAEPCWWAGAEEEMSMTARVVDRLMTLPEELANAEVALLEAEQARADLAARLQSAEDGLLLSGTIDGKNAEQRAAQLRQATVVEREEWEAAAQHVARLKIALHRLQSEHASLRAIARCLTND
jgi:hypothetical protein